MTEKLTDEQLRVWSSANPDHHGQVTVDMATEILALRAERAKATQSDAARNLIDTLENLRGEPMSRASKKTIVEAFASIRAEGTHDGWAACEAKYETLVPELRDSIRAEGSAERAKLEGAGWVDAITDARKLADEAAAGTFHEANTYWAEDLRNRLDGVIAALAQPAESGATFSDGCESMADLQAGAKSAESGATETLIGDDVGDLVSREDGERRLREFATPAKPEMTDGASHGTWKIDS